MIGERGKGIGGREENFIVGIPHEGTPDKLVIRKAFLVERLVVQRVVRSLVNEIHKLLLRVVSELSQQQVCQFGVFVYHYHYFVCGVRKPALNQVVLLRQISVVGGSLPEILSKIGYVCGVLCKFRFFEHGGVNRPNRGQRHVLRLPVVLGFEIGVNVVACVKPVVQMNGGSVLAGESLYEIDVVLRDVVCYHQIVRRAGALYERVNQRVYVDKSVFYNQFAFFRRRH